MTGMAHSLWRETLSYPSLTQYFLCPRCYELLTCVMHWPFGRDTNPYLHRIERLKEMECHPKSPSNRVCHTTEEAPQE